MVTFAIQALRRARHEMPRQFFSAAKNLRPLHNLRKVGRADFLFSFRNKHQIHGQLLAGAMNGVQRGEE